MNASTRNPKVFVYGYYGNRNTGDEIILETILASLGARLRNASFTVMSDDPKQTTTEHQVRAIGRSELHQIAEAIEEADLVVAGGGGLFHDTLGFEPDRIFTTGSGFTVYVAPALYGLLAQKRVMLWGVGIGPFKSDLAREYTKAVCLAADVVTVRDQLSRSLLKSAGVPSSRIIVTADCAFGAKPCKKSAKALRGLFPERSSSGPTVGVAVREWSVDVRSQYWERQLAEALDKFVQSESGRVVFVPFQTLETEKENDLAVARRIASQLSPQTDATVLQERLAPQEVKALIAECDLLVGMRLHSIVFAAQAGVPVVALSYDPKVSALMTRLALRHFDCPLPDIQSGTLRDLMTQALEQRPKISASLRAASEKLAQEAKKTVQLACELLKRPPEPKPLPPELVSVVASAVKEQLRAAKRSDEQLKSSKEQLDERFAWVGKQHAHIEELSAWVGKQHAHIEELIGKLKQEQEQVEELSACIRKQHADNEQLSAQLKQKQEQVEEFSTSVRKQRADNEQLISSVAEKKGEVAKLQEQLQGKDRFVLQLEQRHALEKRELEKQLGEKSAEVTRLDDRIQELANWTTWQNEEIERFNRRNAKLRNLLEFSNRCRQELIELHNARLSVKLRRNLHRPLDFLQSCVPESARAFVRPVYLKFYPLVFPHRYSALLSRQAPASQSGAADSDEAESSETVPEDGAGPAASSRHAPGEVHAYKTSLPFDSYPSYQPKVSVVLPVWNQARLVGESIRSVLEQSYKNLELIVVDDGSTEDLDPVFDKFASDPRVRIIRKSHEGLPKGLNTGFQAVEGEFLTWTSADNVMRPEMIATLLSFLLRNPEVDMTYGNTDLVNDEGAPLIGSDHRSFNQCPNATQRLRLPHTVQTLGLLDDNFIGACFLYRARTGRVVGDYDDALLGTEDYDYWLRVSAQGIIRHVDTEQCLYRYRVHEDTLSAKHGQAQIVPNVQTLVRHHRQRLLYYEKRFDVVIVYDSARGVPQEPVGALARAFRQLGNSVAVVATNGWESSEPDDLYNVLLTPDPDEVRDWLGENRSATKGILLSFVEDPKWLVDLAQVWPADSVFCFYWLAPNSDPSRLTVLREAPGLRSWCLASSKQVAANLPPHFQRRWSSFIPARFACSDQSKLILKARDNTYPGFPL